MSKSKSRQPARKPSDKSGANGINSQTSAASKTTAKAGASVSTATEEKKPVAKQVPAASATTRSLPPTPVPGRAQTRDAAKYERRQAERQMRYLAQRRARRTKVLAWTIGILLVLVVGGSVGFWVYQTRQPARSSSTTAPAPYQEAVFDASYPPVDNVYCDQGEQSVEHIHAYVTMWMNGQQQSLSQSVGVPQSQQGGNPTCLYWLHTHDTSGVIHIEAPAKEPFTFGQFMDEWNQQFQSTGFYSQLLLNTGWTIWINGKVYKGTLNSIPLAAHNIVTIAYNSPKAKPATTYNWGGL